MPDGRPGLRPEGAQLSAAKRLHLGAWPRRLEATGDPTPSAWGVLDDPCRTVRPPLYAR
jgi:hypothetical protein